MRLAVNWFDDQNNSFSGTIDTTLPPYNGNSVEGQSVICAAPSVAADSGIWVLGTHTDPTQVPVTRRADSDISSVFRSGEIIARFDVNGSQPATIYRVSDIYDENVSQLVAEATLDGTGVYIAWKPLIDSDLAVNSINVGNGVFAASENGALASNIEADDRCVAKAFVHLTTNLNVAQSPISTTQRTRTFLLDASGGNIVFNLPAGAVPGANSKSIDITVKRTDSSGNSVTIQVQSGEKLEGVVDGTITLAPLEAAVFTNFDADPNEWWRVGQFLL